MMFYRSMGTAHPCSVTFSSLFRLLGLGGVSIWPLHQRDHVIPFPIFSWQMDRSLARSALPCHCTNFLLSLPALFTITCSRLVRFHTLLLHHDLSIDHLSFVSLFSLLAFHFMPVRKSLMDCFGQPVAETLRPTKTMSIRREPIFGLGDRCMSKLYSVVNSELESILQGINSYRTH